MNVSGRRRTSMSAVVTLSVSGALLVGAQLPAAQATVSRTVTFEVSGAQGQPGAGAFGGAGATVSDSAQLPVGRVVHLTVGGSNGFNGGGAGGTHTGAGTDGGSGGGGSDVRIGGTALADRVLVAGGGGGGGGGTNLNGGDGGGGGIQSAFDGASSSAAAGAGGGGGGATQVVPGSAGTSSGCVNSTAPGSVGTSGVGGAGGGAGIDPGGAGGGGGGGYFGGGGGSGASCGFGGGGGGGGSGFADGATFLGGEIDRNGTWLGDGQIRVSFDGGATWAATFGYTGAMVNWAVPPAPDPTSVTPSRVKRTGGDHLTVVGSLLDTVDAVTVGGLPATFSLNPDNSLDVVVPAGLPYGTVFVQVSSTANGPGDAAPTVFAYRAPTVTAVAPSAVVLGGGTTVTLTGTDFTGSSVTVDDVVPAHLTVSDTTITFTAPAHTLSNAVVLLDNGDTTTQTSLVYDTAPTITSFSPSHGAMTGGQIVLVEGSHFGANPSVMIGSHSVPVVVATPTYVSFLTPSVGTSETDPITVITAVGSATSSSAFLYDAAPLPPNGYTPVPPCRAFDTRGLAQPCSSAAVTTTHIPSGPGSVRTVKVTGIGGVPADATAVVLNLTAVGATRSTFVTAYPTGITRPGSSTLNVNSAGPVADLAVVPVGDDGTISLYNNAGSIDLLGDIDGYYEAGTGAGYTPVVPCRGLDTRGLASPCAGSAVTGTHDPLTAAATRNVKVTGVGAIPVNATAVVINLTAVGATRSTFITAFAKGAARPTASTLNVSSTAPVPNLAVVPIGAAGMISLYNNAGTVDLVADIVGYYAPASGQGYTAVIPCRSFDTRGLAVPCLGGAATSAHVPLGVGEVRTVPVTGIGGVPANATAVVISFTAVGATHGTFITAYPTSATRPTASTLNVSSAAPVANLAIVQVGSAGMISLYNNTGSVDLIGDIVGYYAQ